VSPKRASNFVLVTSHLCPSCLFENQQLT